jgi:hypothetical protein
LANCGKWQLAISDCKWLMPTGWSGHLCLR